MRLDLTEARVQVSSKNGRKRAGVGLGVAFQIKRSGSKSEKQTQALSHKQTFQKQVANWEVGEDFWVGELKVVQDPNRGFLVPETAIQQAPTQTWDPRPLQKTIHQPTSPD